MLVIYFNYYYHLHVILIIIVYMEQRSPNCNPQATFYHHLFFFVDKVLFEHSHSFVCIFSVVAFETQQHA